IDRGQDRAPLGDAELGYALSALTDPTTGYASGTEVATVWFHGGETITSKLAHEAWGRKHVFCTSRVSHRNHSLWRVDLRGLGRRANPCAGSGPGCSGHVAVGNTVDGDDHHARLSRPRPR